MVKIYGVKLLDELRFLELKGLVSAYLPDSSAKKASRFKHVSDAQRQILGEVLTRAALCNEFNLDNHNICFGYSSIKKPFLSGRRDIHFNISHSGKWVVCAVSEKEVGIDVEKIRKINFNVARRFFSTTEVDQLFSLPEKAQLNYFFDLWTLKESYLKALGTGLTKPLSSFTVGQSQGKIKLVDDEGQVEVFLKKYKLDSNHKLSVCSFENNFSENIERLFIDDLLRMIE
ncbi:MAG: hypothetical protein B6D64_09075 [Bacteroidetes bacterium 4484_276]|nr:MAG: hypothetical protein B6D64_09075 [Bacteroidetes bacterium 4484_276]